MAAPFSLGDYTYAHRGRWSPDGPPENSLAAYAAAAAAGLGLELDVRLSADGVPVCFHDPDLNRLTDLGDHVAACTADMLMRTKLKGSNETIPSLTQLLDMWPHHLPLLVEIKAQDVPPGPIADATASLLATYPGRAAAMSFSIAAVAALPKMLPRGLLVEPAATIGEADFQKRLRAALDLQVDYLASRHEDAPTVAPFARRHGLGLVVWTVRTPDAFRAAQPHVDAQIVEGFDPALALAEAR